MRPDNEEIFVNLFAPGSGDTETDNAVTVNPDMAAAPEQTATENLIH